MANQLKGQVAIVTGAGRGIGVGIALELAKAGAAVAAVSRTAAQVDETVSLIDKEGGRAIAIAADVKEPGAFERVLVATEARFGPVDLLVNNAAVINPLGRSWEVDLDEWQEAMQINVTGPFLGARAVLPGMLARGRGRIINVSSGVIRGPLKYGSAYSVSKVAMHRLTESLAVELERTGVSVFNLDPGRVKTDMPDIVNQWEADQDWLPHEPDTFTGYLSPSVPGATCVLIATGAADVLSGRFFGVHDDIQELVRQAQRIKDEDLYTIGIKQL